MTKIISIAGGVIVVAIAAAFFFLWRELKETRHDLLKEQTRGYESVIRHADSTARSHKDSLLIIERKVNDVTTTTATAIATVRNTRNVDSLVVLYWRHRASESNRFLNRGD